jgi:hypothetical protein
VSISVTCECGQEFETPEANAGCRLPCPACGRELTVPKPAPTTDEWIDTWELESSSSGKAIASLTLGILFFFGCLSGLPAIFFGRLALRDIRLSQGRRRGKGMAVAGIVLGVIGCLFTLALILPEIRSAREAARRAECTNNLKQIGLAMFNYHESWGSLPLAAITDKNGRPLLSWRVAILPRFDSTTLYNDFHLDEPWDSPHNLTLLNRMPPIYACPSDSTLKPGMTGYQAVIGPDTAFTPDFKPVRFQDLTGTTLLVSESRRTVPWTKPEDLPFDMTVPLTGLGSHHGYHNNGFNAVFSNGAVRFLKVSIPPSTLRSVLTRRGNDGDTPLSY